MINVIECIFYYYIWLSTTLYPCTPSILCYSHDTWYIFCGVRQMDGVYVWGECDCECEYMSLTNEICKECIYSMLCNRYNKHAIEFIWLLYETIDRKCCHCSNLERFLSPSLFLYLSFFQFPFLSLMWNYLFLICNPNIIICVNVRIVVLFGVIVLVLFLCACVCFSIICSCCCAL